MDMDGKVETFAKRFALSPAVVRRQRVALPGGAQFVFADYERAQSEATEWLRDKMEYRLGMATFVENFIRHVTPEKMRGPNGGHKWTPERTLKSFCLQEPESFSRDAKVLWCARHGHAVLSLQHDGIVVALADGTDASAACDQLRAASERALGYKQPVVIKAPELPDGVSFQLSQQT